MTEVLQDIHIGEESMDSIDFRYDVVGVPLRKGHDREFAIFIKNFGPPTSVSFDVDASLNDYVIFVERRPYVQNNLYVRLIVRVPYNSSLAAEGNFYVITGYGSRRKSFRLRVGATADGSVSGALTTSEAKWDDETAAPPSDDGDADAAVVFRVREDWESVRRRNSRDGKIYGTPYNYRPKEKKSTDPDYDKVPYPSFDRSGTDARRARTGRDSASGSSGTRRNSVFGFFGTRRDSASGSSGTRRDSASGSSGTRRDSASGFSGTRRDSASGSSGTRRDSASGSSGTRRDSASGFSGKRRIRTAMDIRGTVVSAAFVLFLALFFLYILFTNDTAGLESGQIWLLSAIIVGLAVFMIVFILNFFKTTVEE